MFIAQHGRLQQRLCGEEKDHSQRPRCEKFLHIEPRKDRAGDDGDEHQSAKTGELAEVEILNHHETPGGGDSQQQTGHGAGAGKGFCETHRAIGIDERSGVRNQKQNPGGEPGRLER